MIIILFITGCKSSKKQESKFQKMDKAPDSLGDISDDIQDILKNIEKIETVLDGTDIEDAKYKEQEEKEKEKEKEQSQDQGQEKKEEEDSKGKSGDSSSDTSEESKGQDKNKPKLLDKDERLLKTWEEVDKKIESVHKKWNIYEVEGMKKGLTMDNSNKFEESLNAMTKSIEKRSIIEIYDYSSQSMLNLAPMFDLYKDEIKGDINRIKYAAYQSYLKTIENNPIEAANLLKNSEENINKIRLKLDKKDGKVNILDKVGLSVADARKSLEENSRKLNRIKRDIIIDNLEELAK